MSRTLFWYVFKDLFRIFFLACAALAGIMSFGGLLRPIYEQGLNAAQVGKLLAYFMPAMTTYSLPIAALFATTMVYGRLSADNEITACRAAGIPLGPFGMALPAMVMGLILALVSLLLLCFIVPIFWLKIENVLYSNLAEVVANQIHRTHQIRFDHSNTSLTVYAQDAEVLPVERDRPREQRVRLIAPTIVTYDSSDKNRPPVPEEFYMARTATAVIRQPSDDSNVLLYASLEGGMRFPRRTTGRQKQSVQVSVGQTNFGPIALPSPIKENTKFLDIFRLQRLLARPELGRRVRTVLGEFIRAEQEELYLQTLERELSADPSGTATFEAGPEEYLLQRGSATLRLERRRLVLMAAPDGGAPVRLIQRRQGREVVLDASAREVRIRCFAMPDDDRIDVEIEMLDCTVGTGGDEPTARPNFTRPFSVPMPQAVVAALGRTSQDYLQSGRFSGHQQQRLYREVKKIENSIVGELNARASFGVSCFILVMVGCALGMMFRSGNFLSAFALSVVPALLCIALIVTGQHTCENVPWTIQPGDWNNPLPYGLALIWSGNAAVAVIATVLLWRLQRQ
jgi:lipopolysaccharide export LptBFGC system permease protein LptF